jgi:hypothetical protein
MSFGCYAQFLALTLRAVRFGDLSGVLASGTSRE